MLQELGFIFYLDLSVVELEALGSKTPRRRNGATSRTAARTK